MVVVLSPYLRNWHRIENRRARRWKNEVERIVRSAGDHSRGSNIAERLGEDKDYRKDLPSVHVGSRVVNEAVRYGGRRLRGTYIPRIVLHVGEEEWAEE